MFTYFIPLTVDLTKNSKLEKFVHELNALWKLSGSSMGALRELVTVAGMLYLSIFMIVTCYAHLISMARISKNQCHQCLT